MKKKSRAFKDDDCKVTVTIQDEIEQDVSLTPQVEVDIPEIPIDKEVTEPEADPIQSHDKFSKFKNPGE